MLIISHVLSVVNYIPKCQTVIIGVQIVQFGINRQLLLTTIIKSRIYQGDNNLQNIDVDQLKKNMLCVIELHRQEKIIKVSNAEEFFNGYKAGVEDAIKMLEYPPVIKE